LSAAATDGNAKAHTPAMPKAKPANLLSLLDLIVTAPFPTPADEAHLRRY